MFGFLRPKKILGIDIGTSAIKVVELRKKRNGVVLENYGEAQIAPFSDKPFRVLERNTLFLSDQEIASTIKEICEEAKIKIKEVNFSVPDYSSFFTNFQLPPMSKEEVVEAIRYEVRPYIPMPIAEINLSWVVTEGEFSKTPLKILAVAIPNEVIFQYQEIAEMAGLNLKVLEPEVLPFARASLHKDDKNKLIGLIDIGARSTTCSILDKGILKASHSSNIGANELTEVMSKSLSITSFEAEMLRKKYGLSMGDAVESVRDILLPMIDSIIKEVKDVFRNFYTTEGREIEKVIIGGGAALLPGLKEYFKKELAKDVEIADPFLEISYPSAIKGVLSGVGPSYAIAVGLALKAFE